MKEDLIFHLTTIENWENNKDGAIYCPESIEEEGFIHCSSGNQIQQTANRLFKGMDSLILVVINTTLLDEDIKYEKDEELDQEFPHIYGPLNTGAVIERIPIAPEEDGTFDISFRID